MLRKAGLNYIVASIRYEKQCHMQNKYVEKQFLKYSKMRTNALHKMVLSVVPNT